MTDNTDYMRSLRAKLDELAAMEGSASDTDAYEQGYAAGQDELTHRDLDNPYNDQDDPNDNHGKWQDGWKDGRNDIGGNSGRAYDDMMEDDEPAVGPKDSAEEPDDAPAGPAPEPSDDDSEDGLVKGLMTNKTTQDKLSGSMNVAALAQDLGLDDTEAGQFNTAFNKLKNARTLGMGDFAAITAVFDRILSSDASTTSKVINKLRAIHKTAAPSLAESNDSAGNTASVLDKHFFIHGKHKIGTDGRVHVDGDVILKSKTLPGGKLPVKFGKVTGGFHATHSNLSNLEGAPEHVGGDFNVSNNQLNNLDGAPQHVGGKIHHDGNPMTKDKMPTMEGQKNKKQRI